MVLGACHGPKTMSFLSSAGCCCTILSRIQGPGLGRERWPEGGWDQMDPRHSDGVDRPNGPISNHLYHSLLN
jgi:hypothetical protein